tara:strand:- start:281 stop:1849 length:1569 start_codon:yes stop_codon:yes gene_type:complete
MEKIDFIKDEIKSGNFKSAERKLLNLISGNNNNYQYYFLLGYIYEKEKKFPKAIENYKIAKKLNKSETIINNLANTYIKSNNYILALKELSESLKLNNKNPKTFNNYGLLLISQRKELESIKYFEAAIDLNKDYMDPKYNLLEILEKTNNKVLLEKYLKKEITNFPNNKILKYFNSVYLSLNNKNKEALSVLQSLKFTRFENNWEYRRLNLLGIINDKIGKYRQAFKFHKDANEFLINNNCQNLFNEKKYYNKLINLKKYNKHKDENNDKINHNKTTFFFLVGFPRSGTTLLDSILSSHSKITVLEEQPLIENTINKLTEKQKIICNNLDKDKLRKTYFEQVSKITNEEQFSNKIIIDKMPLNLIYLNLIKNLFPESKIIFSLRHPLDTILSCYFQNFILNEAMVNFLDLQRTAEIFSICMEIFSSQKQKKSKNMLFVKYENLVSNFNEELLKICKFMEIKEELAMKNYYRSVSKKQRVRTASYNQVNKPIYTTSKYRWLNYKNELLPIMNIVDKWIKYYKY